MINTNVQSAPFRIISLVFIKNTKGEFLMLKRNKAPNEGLWSPVGGKLAQEIGESPFECAVRETKEETGFHIQEKDLHLFAMISEKNYESCGHWLIFLFDCRRAIEFLPAPHQEGSFAFLSREALRGESIPRSDDLLMWNLYDQHHDGSFIALDARFDQNNQNMETRIYQKMLRHHEEKHAASL